MISNEIGKGVGERGAAEGVICPRIRLLEMGIRSR